MSTNRNSAHRRSLPVNTSEYSHILRQERLRVGDDIRNRDLHISSLRGLDNDNDNRARACKPPTAISHRINEDTDCLEARNSSDEDETSSLTDDIKRNKIEAMKMTFYQEKILKEKFFGYNSDITYQAGKKEVKKILWRRGRSYSCSYRANAFPPELELNTGSDDVQVCLQTDDDVENINASTRCVKLPSIFEKNVTNSRHSASANHANIKHVHYDTSDDKSHLKKRRKQNNVGMQDTLLDKELRSKVKEFLQKPQPKASLPSLRITEKIPDVQLHVKGKGNNNYYNTDLTEQFMRVPVNTETCPLMSHFKDRKWYYQDKSGKCRYLRVPESPIPPVSFVFSKD